MRAKRVAFYTPLTPLSFPKPSGDRTLARNLVKALERNGHQVRVMSEFRGRQFWLRPKRWGQILFAFLATYRATKRFRPEAWLTFVSDPYVPDLFGPIFSSRLGIPYVIYQALFRGDYQGIRLKEGRVRHLWTALPGYLLNLYALTSADHVIADKSGDHELRRWGERLSGFLEVRR